VTYVSPITGHGLRKLMRADRELTYRVRELPAVPEVLAFLVAAAGLSPAEAYATFNMGAGLAVFCRPGAGAGVVAAAASVGLGALVAGSVEAGPRRVVLDPLRSAGEPVEYGGGELELR
jgi:phosphoribosylformylglycinamidine cyclo-ligase